MIAALPLMPNLLPSFDLPIQGEDDGDFAELFMMDPPARPPEIASVAPRLTVATGIILAPLDVAEGEMPPDPAGLLPDMPEGTTETEAVAADPIPPLPAPSPVEGMAFPVPPTVAASLPIQTGTGDAPPARSPIILPSLDATSGEAAPPPPGPPIDMPDLSADAAVAPLLPRAPDIPVAEGVPFHAAPPDIPVPPSTPVRAPDAVTAPVLPPPADPVAQRVLEHVSGASPDADLGPVQVVVEREGDQIRIVLLAERADTLDLMRRHADQFLADLSREGFAKATCTFAHPPADEGEPALEEVTRLDITACRSVSGLDLRL